MNPDRLPVDTHLLYPDLTSSLSLHLNFQPSEDRELLGAERHQVAKVVHTGRSPERMLSLSLALRKP